MRVILRGTNLRPLAMTDLEQTEVDELLTVRDWIRWGASSFESANLYYGHGTDNAWDDAAQLLLWSISIPWNRLEQVLEARLTLKEKSRLLDLYKKRVEQRLPAPYLTGEAFFAGLSFKVTPDVLIPRSPIAELIAQRFEPWLSQEPLQVLDLCTGSGCIGITIAMTFLESEVYLSDICAKALTVAVENVEQYSLSDRVGVVESDLFAAIPGEFDLIVSNPPYVDAEDMGSLPEEYQVEPSLALASGEDGLNFTRRLLREAAAHLSPEGILVVEVGNSSVALVDAYPDVPFTWLEFENGGQGVFVLTKQQLCEYNGAF